MKRITSIFLVVCLCLNLAGCSSDAGNNGGSSDVSGNAVTSEDALEEAGKLLKKMTLEEKIGQMFIVDVDKLTESNQPVTSISPQILELIEEYKIGGVVFGSQNIESTDQITSMIQDINDFVNASAEMKVPLYIGTQEEGGGENSIAATTEDINSTGYISPSEMGENMTEGQFEDTGKVIAEELQKLGFNLNFAPVADVAEVEKMADSQAISDSAVAVIGERPVYTPPAKKISKAKKKKRLNTYNKKLQEYQTAYDKFLQTYTEDNYLDSCFSEDEDKVSEAVASMVRGMHSEGMCTVLKTFPGISSVARYHKLIQMDIDTGLSKLRKVNFVPFSAGIEKETDVIMVGHVSLSKIDKYVPASLSRTILSELIRKEMGFEGIIMTEQMDVPVITNNYTTEQAVIRAIASGADVIYDPEDLEEAISAVKLAVMFKEIDEKTINQAVLRILQNKILREIYPLPDRQ